MPECVLTVSIFVLKLQYHSHAHQLLRVNLLVWVGPNETVTRAGKWLSQEGIVYNC